MKSDDRGICSMKIMLVAASCTCLEFAGVLYKINSRDGIKKILQQRLGAGESGGLLFILHCVAG